MIKKKQIFTEHLEETFKPFLTQTADENVTSNIRNNIIEISQVSLKELKQVIKSNLSAKKSPGYDLIIGQVLKELPNKALVMLLQLINAVLRLKYVPRQWKVAEVVMIPKLGKP